MVKDDNKMPPPPVGCQPQESIGDKPLDMPDADFSNDVTYVACVLHGTWPHPDDKLRERVPDLSERYVEHLYEMVSKFMPANIRWRFVCFTDRAPHHMPGIPTRSLPRGYNGWFNKLYLFSPDAFPAGARVLYLDLDTAIVGDLSPLCQVPLDAPVFLRDVWAASHAASGLFSFRSGPALYPIWETFKARGLHPPSYDPPKDYPTPPWGHPNGAQWRKPERIRTDEQWIHHFIYPDKWKAWQDVLPGSCYSYKFDILGMNNKFHPAKPRTWQPEHDPALRVVFFHGQPRPHTVVRRWNPHWRGVCEPPQAAITPHRIDTPWQ